METIMENKQKDVQSNYLETQVSTATKEQLLLITYDIGIRACQTAEGALDAKDYEVSNKELLRAQSVIRELMVTLNVEKGGEVATGLMRLYDFMHEYLVQANIEKSSKKVSVVTGMLKELRQTWEEALLKLLEEYNANSASDSTAKSVSAAPVPQVRAAAAQHQSAARPAMGGVNIAG